MERRVSKVWDMKLLTRIVVMWRNDAAKASIVTKRSLASSGGVSSSGQSMDHLPTELGSEWRAAAGPATPAHSRRRASVHAYSHFMSSQLRRASMQLDRSFADDIALTPAKSSADDLGLSRGPLLPLHAFDAHESPNHNFQTAAVPAMRTSDL